MKVAGENLPLQVVQDVKNIIGNLSLMSEKTKKTISKSFMERVVFEATIEYKCFPETHLYGFSCNLSVGGLYLRTKLPLEVDDTLTLSFSLPVSEETVPISCAARVAWINNASNRLKPDYASGVGLQFLNLSPEDSSILERFIEAYEADKRMNLVCAWCGRSLGVRKGPSGKTSHGLCSQCFEKLNN